MAPAFVHRDRNTVCVMDASSRLGLPLVKRLLQRGYTVHAASFIHGGDQSSGGSLGLKRLAGGEGGRRLKLFRADPFDYQTIVDAVRGCAGCFYAFEAESYDEAAVEEEVRGAHNALEACSQVESVERVVFTSSLTAVVWSEGRRQLSAEHEHGADVDEREWSDPNFCRKRKLWHALAKTLAERTAWALAMDRGIDMVSINAGLLAAAPAGRLPPTDPYLRGTPQMYEDGVLATVDGDFLVSAHIAAYESPSAYGRYLCFSHAVCRPQDAVKLAQMLFPNAACPPLPSNELRAVKQRIQNKKLNKLMMEFDAEAVLEA